MAARLDAARERSFVGRVHELELFRTALTADRLPFAVLYIHGPGGVGKSALLGRLRREAERRALACYAVDGADLRANAEAIGQALQPAADRAEAGTRRCVLLIDAYEATPAIDRWLRDDLVPALPEETVVVVAGREPPGAAWREDLGWRALLKAVSLRNLREDETSALLAQLGVPGQLHARVHALTHGHALAVALLADMVTEQGLEDADLRALPPGVVRALLERFVSDVGDEQRRSALEICAHVRAVTVTTLRAMLGEADCEALFDWLRGRPFVTERDDGLVMHDLVRELLDSDLMWRDRQRYVDMHRRLREHYLDQFWQATEADRVRAFNHMMYMHRANPVFQQFFALGRHDLTGQPLRAEDQRAVLEMVEQHEGEASASIAEYWMARCPEAFRLFRDSRGTVQGFLAHLILERPTEDDLAVDPGMSAAWDFIQRTAPLRPGELFSLGRLWMDRDGYHAPTPVSELVATHTTTEWLQNQRLGWSINITGDPAQNAPMFLYIDFHPSGVSFTVGDHSYVGFAHDWRVRPPRAWLDLMGDRELDDDMDLHKLAHPEAQELLVLSEPDFEAAVREVLRLYHRPAALASNPLVRSRMVVEAGDADAEPAGTLARLVRETAGELEASPKDRRLFRALDATYFHPASTQEAAAEHLDLPFSTYRRHLSAGIARVVAMLWDRELRGATR